MIFFYDVPVDSLYIQLIYLISLYEQVKEPYPTAHPLNAGNKLLFFIHIEVDTLMSLTKSIGAIDGFISVRI